MTKFKKLKTYNILIFALVPLLLIAMVATVTLAAMTHGVEGGNTINIGRIGTVSCTVNADSDEIYPGGTSTVNLSMTYSGVAGSQNINQITIAPSSFSIKSIKVYTPNHNTDSTAWTITTPSDFLTNVSFNNNSTVTLNKGTAKAVPLKFTVKEGMDSGSTSSENTPKYYLVYSATKIVINFDITVSASGTTFS